MQPVVIVGPLTDIALALARYFSDRGVPLYVITDNSSEWQISAPGLFKGRDVLTEETVITFNPSYLILVPGAMQVPPNILTINSKAISVLPYEYRQSSPSYHQQLLFPTQVEADPNLPLTDRVENIIRQVFSFGGNATVFTNIQKLQLPQTQAELIAPVPEVNVSIVSKQPVLQPIPKPLQTGFPGRRKKRKFIWLILVVLFVLMLPFTILGIATALTLVGVKLVTIGELSLARKAFAASGSVSTVASIVPGTTDSGYVLQRITKTGEQGTYVIEHVNEILTGVFSTESYPLVELSSQLQKELQVIYRELSFLETEVQKENNLFYSVMPLAEIQKARKAASAGADIAGRLPSLLGVDKQKTYLVLLQNNMELRPTGGFIGSFSLINFAGGRLIDAPVYDVYSADGQLKGHVEPPPPIKDYLGEANWYLRDSNWDPDFPTSASRAEWFLDKTLGTPIDGVIAIDLEFVRKLIGSQGELGIDDFDLQLTEDNFYELLQTEVHKDFFPGSRKKAAVLTATMNALMANIFGQVENRNTSRCVIECDRQLMFPLAV